MPTLLLVIDAPAGFLPGRLFFFTNGWFHQRLISQAAGFFSHFHKRLAFFTDGWRTDQFSFSSRLTPARILTKSLITAETTSAP